MSGRITVGRLRVSAGIAVVQLAADFTFSQGIRGIAFDGTYWYHAASTGGGSFDHIVRETYPTRGSATTIYTAGGSGFADISGLTCDGTNLYWVETDSIDTFFSMPVGSSTPSSIATGTQDRNHSLVWHPTDGLLYWEQTATFGAGVQEESLRSMTTAGGSAATIYTSAHSTVNADNTHLSDGLFPMSPSPGYLWGGQTPNGSAGHPGMFVYELGASLMIGLRTEQVLARGGTGLKSDHALYTFNTAPGHLHEVDPTPSDLGVWSLEDAGMVSDLTSRWSTHSSDFHLTHFGAGGHIWEIAA